MIIDITISGENMGTKGGKPITAIEKRQRRELEKRMRARIQQESESPEGRLVFYNENILNQALKEIKNLSYVTPYILMTKLNVAYGVAKDILNELEKRGYLRLYSRNRRVLIYVPIAAK